MFQFQSALFAGDPVLQNIADDAVVNGQHVRIDTTQNTVGDATLKVQRALVNNFDAEGLPEFGMDGRYGLETTALVVRFKEEVLGVANPIGDVGPLTVQKLDELQAANEAAGAQPPGGAPPFVRKEISGLEAGIADGLDPITLAYANAVVAMQALPITDPRSGEFQAAIHAKLKPRTPPPGSSWNQCQHDSWFFLPWHRMYLFFFERIVRSFVVAQGGPADFALPYWNYELPGNATLPTAFLTPAFLPDGTPNPLHESAGRRDQALAAGGSLSATAISSANAMASTVFTALAGPSFGGPPVGPAHFGQSSGLLESRPHNAVHNQIGGNASGAGCSAALMSSFECAALDPIFWLHHANIDRLWNVWLSTPGNALPVDKTWLSQSFPFHDENGDPVSVQVADVLDSTSDLGYVYDTLPNFSLPVVPPPPSPPAPPQLIAATAAALDLSDAAAAVTLVGGPDALATLQALVDEAAQVFVTVEDIVAPAAAATYVVNLHVPQQDGSEVLVDIGSLTTFGAEMLDDPDFAHLGAPGMRQSFDVTDVVNNVLAQGIFDPSAVTLTFEPDLVVPPPGFAEAPPAPPVVTVGRVALFAG